MEYQCLEGCGVGKPEELDLTGIQFGNGCSGGCYLSEPQNLIPSSWPETPWREPLVRNGAMIRPCWGLFWCIKRSDTDHQIRITMIAMVVLTTLFVMLMAEMIRRYIWRWARKDCLSHDAFHCSKFSKTKAFPTRRGLQANNFVGAVGCPMSITIRPSLLFQVIKIKIILCQEKYPTKVKHVLSVLYVSGDSPWWIHKARSWIQL